MGSERAQNVSVIENNEAEGADAMIDVKIKTLNSETYTLRVDKCVPVPELKENIATVTGTPSEQQRLICRGKVLKDDQVLSAYGVEDGHTLHLVVRQPDGPLGGTTSSNSATDPASTPVYDEQIEVYSNLSNQGDGIPDIDRLMSAVNDSTEITRTESGSLVVLIIVSAAYRSYIMSGREQNDEPYMRDQTISSNSTASYPSGPHSDPLQPQDLPDSLTTLTQYLSHLTQECDAIVENLVVYHKNSECCICHSAQFLLPCFWVKWEKGVRWTEMDK